MSVSNTSPVSRLFFIISTKIGRAPDVTICSLLLSLMDRLWIPRRTSRTLIPCLRDKPSSDIEACFKIWTMNPTTLFSRILSFFWSSVSKYDSTMMPLAKIICCSLNFSIVFWIMSASLNSLKWITAAEVTCLRQLCQQPRMNLITNCTTSLVVVLFRKSRSWDVFWTKIDEQTNWWQSRADESVPTHTMDRKFRTFCDEGPAKVTSFSLCLNSKHSTFSVRFFMLSSTSVSTITVGLFFLPL